MMSFIIMLASIFLLGLAVGSFLNVVIYRTLHGDSPWSGRSKCPHCKKTIRALDNIPLFSYLFLKGKCRSCGKTISWSYPVVEFLTGSLFVWWYLSGSLFFKLSQSPFLYIQPVFWLIVGAFLIAVFFTDLLHGVIPDVLLGILGISALIYRSFLVLGAAMQGKDFAVSILSGIGVSLFFLGLIVLTRGKGMGMGDVKLAMVMGIILGWPRILVAVFLSFVLGALVSMFLIIVGKRKFGQTVPFGPFLVAGAFVSLVWGNQLWNQYMHYVR